MPMTPALRREIARIIEQAKRANDAAAFTAAHESAVAVLHQLLPPKLALPFGTLVLQDDLVYRGETWPTRTPYYTNFVPLQDEFGSCSDAMFSGRAAARRVEERITDAIHEAIDRADIPRAARYVLRMRAVLHQLSWAGENSPWEERLRAELAGLLTRLRVCSEFEDTAQDVALGVVEAGYSGSCAELRTCVSAALAAEFSGL